jgi:hypothetical protein
MPETTINEYRQLCRPENEIRFSEHRLMSSPAGYVVLAKHFNQCDFRAFIPASTDA